VAAYLVAHASAHAVSTLQRRLAAISVRHQLAGYRDDELPTRSPEVKTVMVGIRRVHGVAPEKVKAARTKAINALVTPLGTKPIDMRDRALLLIGFAGALRRNELVGLDVADITEDDNGLRLRLRRSKTDQEGETALVGVPYGSNPATCPVRAWRAWREAAALETGPAF
jgi:integrase